RFGVEEVADCFASLMTNVLGYHRFGAQGGDWGSFITSRLAYWFKPILEWDDADWHDQIDVNLTGTCNAIRAVAPHLVANGGGRIIVTSSTQGRHGTKYGAAYSASKWGIIGLMKSAALEFGEHKITVNALIPGLIDTPLTRHRTRYEQAVDDLQSKQP